MLQDYPEMISRWSYCLTLLIIRYPQDYPDMISRWSYCVILLPDVLQESVFYGTRQPPEVTRDNPCELTDLTQNVLLHQESLGAFDVDDIDTTLLKFVMCHLRTTLAGNWATYVMSVNVSLDRGRFSSSNIVNIQSS